MERRVLLRSRELESAVAPRELVLHVGSFLLMTVLRRPFFAFIGNYPLRYIICKRRHFYLLYPVIMQKKRCPYPYQLRVAVKIVNNVFFSMTFFEALQNMDCLPQSVQFERICLIAWDGRGSPLLPPIL